MAVKVKDIRALSTMRASLLEFKNNREHAKEATAEVSHQQEELIPVLSSLDPDGDGIVFDPDDQKSGTAFVQQNQGSLVWNTDKIIEYLKKSRSRWMSCSSRVFDVNKWEAEIANGNIPKSVALKMQEKTDPPKPFIRFGKATDKSK